MYKRQALAISAVSAELVLEKKLIGYYTETVEKEVYKVYSGVPYTITAKVTETNDDASIDWIKLAKYDAATDSWKDVGYKVCSGQTTCIASFNREETTSSIYVIKAYSSASGVKWFTDQIFQVEVTAVSLDLSGISVSGNEEQLETEGVYSTATVTDKVSGNFTDVVFRVESSISDLEFSIDQEKIKATLKQGAVINEAGYSDTLTVKVGVIDTGTFYELASDTIPLSISAVNDAPIIRDASMNPTEPVTGQEVTFKAIVEDVDTQQLSVTWTIDDLTLSPEQVQSGDEVQLTRTFEEDGQHQVILTVSDGIESTSYIWDFVVTAGAEIGNLTIVLSNFDTSINEEIEGTITLTNTGDVDFTYVKVELSTAGGEFDPATIELSSGLAARTSTDVTVKFKPSKCGDFDIVINAIYRFDGTEEGTAVDGEVTISGPDLEPTIELSKEQADVNEAITVKVEVENKGSLTAEEVKVELYANDELIDTADLGLIEGLSTEEVEFNYTVSSEDDIVFKAVVTSSNECPNKLDNNEATAELIVGGVAEEITEITLSNETTEVDVVEGSIIKFDFNNVTYEVRVQSITQEEVELYIEAIDELLVISLNSNMTVDLDQDGVDDLVISYMEFSEDTGKKAKLGFTLIEKVEAEKVEVEEEVKAKVGKGLLIAIIILAVIAAAIVSMILITLKKRSKLSAAEVVETTEELFKRKRKK